MSGGWRRRGRVPAWRPVTWTDERTFKVEQEGVGLNDANIDSWVSALEEEVSPWSSDGLTCVSLNLSRNDLECHGVQQVLRLFIQKKIPIELVKIFKNWVSDHGMQAIADLIRQMPDPVQEIHLSHNQVTSVGALAVLEAVRDTGHYPVARGNHKNPLWLRLENNQIDWEAVLPRLADLSWDSGDTKDAWKAAQRRGQGQEPCPVVMMHFSYYHQFNRSTDGWESWGEHWKDRADGGAQPNRGRGRTGKGNGGSSSGGANGYHGGAWGGYDAEQAEEPGTCEEDSASYYGHLNTDATAAMARASAAASSIAAAAGAAGYQVSRIEEFIRQELMRSTDEHHRKFKLIFSILDDIKKRQMSLEASVKSMESHLHCQHPPHLQQMGLPAPPGAAPMGAMGQGPWQSLPVDGPVGMPTGPISTGPCAPPPGGPAWNGGAPPHGGMDHQQVNYGHVMW